MMVGKEPKSQITLKALLYQTMEFLIEKNMIYIILLKGGMWIKHIEIQKTDLNS